MVDAIECRAEEIPDAHLVFMRAHKMHFRDGVLNPGVFRAHEGGMSVNWSRYATAVETQQQATKDPNDNAVISMPVGGIRRIDDLKVEHTPEPTNRAHSEIFGIPSGGEQQLRVRTLLGRIAEIALPLP